MQSVTPGTLTYLVRPQAIPQERIEFAQFCLALSCFNSQPFHFVLSAIELLSSPRHTLCQPGLFWLLSFMHPPRPCFTGRHYLHGWGFYESVPCPAVFVMVWSSLSAISLRAPRKCFHGETVDLTGSGTLSAH